MKKFYATLIAFLLVFLTLPGAAQVQTAEKPDLTKDPTLYVVGYAHLDTEWRWEYPQVINEYLRGTMEDNFKLLDKYPHYIFNFSGANRYRFMKEYFPEISQSSRSMLTKEDGIQRALRWKRGCQCSQRRSHHPASSLR